MDDCSPSPFFEERSNCLVSQRGPASAKQHFVLHRVRDDKQVSPTPVKLRCNAAAKVFAVRTRSLSAGAIARKVSPP
jgi:hypothetical protein